MSSDASTSQLIALVVGSMGLGYTVYGKKQGHALALGCGVLLMVAPYGISNPPVLLMVGLALMLLPFLLRSR
jgi:hypothetical protein